MIGSDSRAPRPAGFWRRALALLVDLLVFEFVHFSFGLLAGWLWGPGIGEAPEFRVAVVSFALLFVAVYTTVLHAWGGQTLGKALVGARVVAVDGGPLPPRAALLRFVAYGASVATLGFGYVMAGLRADRRALHDLLAGSRVERA